jgi:3-hydroxypropanoate dehydrogenase
MPVLDDASWRLLLLEARTHRAWLERPVDEATLRRLYELARLGPTGGNTQPLRVLFVRSMAAKERLRAALDAGNVDKTMSAPVTAIVAWDVEFHEKMAKLAPERPDLGRSLHARAPRLELDEACRIV